MHSISSGYLTASFTTKGAELKSLKNSSGFEYIWQGDPEIWERSAPVLFPIVGEAANGIITVDGQQYELNRHGFARDSNLMVFYEAEDELVFTLEASEETLVRYPFYFSFSVGYKLEKKSLITTFTVKNAGDTDMYFSVGAHPGFNLPTGNLQDYYIKFENAETLHRHLLKNNLFNGATEEITSDTQYLFLNHQLFDKDAIVLKDFTSTSAQLKSKEEGYSITMDFEGFPYFGIWTKPATGQFICLEPWCGLADSRGFNGELKDKEGIIALQPGELFERSFTVTFNN